VTTEPRASAAVCVCACKCALGRPVGLRVGSPSTVSQKGRLICVRPTAGPAIAEFVKVSRGAGATTTTRRTARSTGQLVVSYWSVRRHGGRGSRDRRQMYGIHSRDQSVNGAINISQSTTSSTSVARGFRPFMFYVTDLSSRAINKDSHA